MTPEQDPYYGREEVSNSDLTWLKKYFMPKAQVIDLETAFRFGTLIDCMITEKDRVNYFNLTCAGAQYSKEEFEQAEEMKKSFYRDEFCRKLAAQACMQKVSIKPKHPVSWQGFDFCLDKRGKWDLFVEGVDMSGEIKSTACTSQKQFEESISYFDYHRQGAWYLDLEGRSNHMIIGISKKYPYKVFKVPFTRGSDLFNKGLSAYQELSFKWFTLFNN
jgi:hypothetical protein